MQFRSGGTGVFHSNCTTATAAVMRVPSVPVFRVRLIRAMLTASPEPTQDPPWDSGWGKRPIDPSMSIQTDLAAFARETAEGASLTSPTRPPYPVTAADRGRSGRARVFFDDSIADSLEIMAERRSLNVAKYGRKQREDHLVGVVGELAVATWLDGAINTTIFDDFEGDSGVDVEVPLYNGSEQYSVQVKTTREMESPERTVDRSVLDVVDSVVLCVTESPRSHVEIVGHIPSRDLRQRANQYGKNGPAIRSDNILPVPEPNAFFPDDIRCLHDTPNIE